MYHEIKEKQKMLKRARKQMTLQTKNLYEDWNDFCVKNHGEG